MDLPQLGPPNVATLELPAPPQVAPAPLLDPGPVVPIKLPPPAPAQPEPATVATMDLPANPPASGEKLGPGPGPASGAASHHWLMPAPDLPPGWFFGAARRYWDAFRMPIVVDPALIGALPAEKSLAITLLASRAGADAARARISADWPNVQIDLVAADTPDGLQAELDRRAHDRKEFG
jgi:hypothetical protein